MIYSQSFDSRNHAQTEREKEKKEYTLQFDTLNDVVALQLASAQLPKCEKIPDGVFYYRQNDDDFTKMELRGGLNMSLDELLAKLGRMMNSGDFSNVSSEESRTFQTYDGNAWTAHTLQQSKYDNVLLTQQFNFLTWSSQTNRITVQASGVYFPPVVAEAFGFESKIYYDGATTSFVAERPSFFGGNHYTWRLNTAGKVEVVSIPSPSPQNFTLRFEPGPLTDMLGFEPNVQYFTANHVLTAPHALDPVYPKYVVLRLLNNASVTNLHEDQPILAKILFHPSAITEQMVYTRFLHPVKMSKLRFQWVDNYNQTMNFDDRNFTLTILFTTKETNILKE